MEKVEKVEKPEQTRRESGRGWGIRRRRSARRC